MTPYLEDADCTLWHGDVLDVLAELPAESVDCVVTSPPYWGLRDYGTGAWEGGDEGCDHAKTLIPRALDDPGIRMSTLEGGKKTTTAQAEGSQFRDVCGKCGARRVDNQLGLEPTPDQYVQRMVEVFREVRRVLAPHGTCWVNLGDSYAATLTSDRHFTQPTGPDGTPATKHPPQFGGQRTAVAGLKPKDLVGIPWRVAFALQQDGWWLRSDIVWAKPNPMPESVTDRPTKAHEYVFLLAKQPKYFFDQEAVRESYTNTDTQDTFRAGSPAYLNQQGPQNNSARGPDGRRITTVRGADGSIQHRDGERWPGSGRNVRSVWTIPTQPYPEAHFATYPEELVRRCVLAGCPERVCRTCGEPSVRIVERELVATRGKINPEAKRDGGPFVASSAEHSGGVYGRYETETLGWSDCGHNNWRPGVVLDPFVGSGTTCKVARDHGRHSIGIDLNADYLALAATRLQQLSLLTGEAHASQ